MDLNLKSLIGKLNDTSRRALESAAGLCLSRTNYNVEIEHWLLKLLEVSDTDFARLLRYYEVDQARVNRDLTRAIEKLKTGNSRPPSLSPQIVDLVREAWVLSSIEFGAPAVRTGHLLLALLSDADLARQTRDSAPDLARIGVEALRKELRDITAGGVEDEPAAAEGVGQAPIPTGAGAGKTVALDQFTVDLTLRARQGHIDPVLGRDFEIRQVIDILTRRRQNNPILTGEAGVGKTAVVEGFALRIAAGDVPAPLKNVALRTLDLGLLQAGAGVKGEFENRLKSVINEVKASPQPIILFIDEAHTMIGAGGQAGQNDAANLLKPALARGELRTIAATTWSEYKKYFEKDAALARRFQVVKVEEPSEEAAINMMRGLAGTLEKHHNQRILDEANVEAVRLSHRYITGRQLPDKAVSLLDTACARVAIGHGATPPAIEDAQRRIDALAVEIGMLEREAATGAAHGSRINELKTDKAATEKRLGELQERWKKESELIGKIKEIRQKLEAQVAPPKDGKKSDAKSDAAAKSQGKPAEPASPPLSEAEVQRLQGELEGLTGQLKQLQGEEPLMQPCVDAQTVAAVVSAWTGIPVGKMLTDEINTVLSLKEKMEERIIGQSHALEAIAQRIRTARAGLVDPRRPVGVFLMVGPSGVGKTETALTLADILYGGERNMVTINMSEYQEAHTVSSLKGSPPGYVGYGEGGVLTEAVRRKPYSVVLLDEIEKAHNDVMELFYQVFDKGMLEDGEGREIDFKNTIILLTSNAGTDTFMKLCADPETRPEPAALAEAIRPDLLKVFKPAFLGRMTVVPYYPLADEVMRSIIRLQLGRIGNRLRENHRAAFSYSDDVVAAVHSRCKEVESGARNVDHILTGTLLPEISREFLGRMAEGKPIERVNIGVGQDGSFQYEIV
ncbi:MAG TPA: type VI secretion system ATPase TssH [Pirellulales bacterium]|nr:type VI secretion system ATPase TssH [Pirellulales bacterium]